MYYSQPKTPRESAAFPWDEFPEALPGRTELELGQDLSSNITRIPPLCCRPQPGFQPYEFCGSCEYAPCIPTRDPFSQGLGSESQRTLSYRHLAFCYMCALASVKCLRVVATVSLVLIHYTCYSVAFAALVFVCPFGGVLLRKRLS